MIFKKKLFNLIVNLKRKSEKGGKIFFSRRFFHNPHLPIKDLDKSNLGAIKKILQVKSGAVIDVGANIGKVLNNILFIDENIKYIGFEPQPYAASMIQIFINENHLKDKFIFPIGLSDKFSVEDLYSFGDDFSNFYNPGATNDETFIETHKEKSLKRKIVLENGDRMLKSLNVEDIAVIKIDVEGAERKVIEGLKQTISNKRPFLIFEMLPFSLRNLKEDIFYYECKSLLESIRSKNMTIFSILQSDLDHSTEIISFSDKDLTLENNILDYIAVPNELMSEFKKILEMQ